MSRRRRYELPDNKNSTFTLNITSLTDMFTILLVFLLQSYSTSTVEMEMDTDLRLPASSTFVNPTESVKLSISTKTLKMDATTIATLQDSDFAKNDVESTDTNFIKPLFEELDKIAKNEGDKPHVKEGKILLQADKNLPYSTLRKVMYTASMAGFPQLKLVTMVGE